MRIVVIGGTGLIGRKLVTLLRNGGHAAVAASPSNGVNSVTGEGLVQALVGADVVIDVSNSPSFADEPVMTFFAMSTRNIVAAARQAQVKHYVALSVVGTDRMEGSGYLRAKLAQETLIRDSGIPHTIVRATQFFEFLGAMAYAGTVGDAVHMPATANEPIAAEEVAAFVADYSVGVPQNRAVDVAGPLRYSLAEIVQRAMAASGDTRRVVVDEKGTYFGAPVTSDSLVPLTAARRGVINFETWLNAQKAA